MAIPFEIGGQRADLHTDAEYKEIIKQTIRESGGTIKPTDPENPDEPLDTNTTTTRLSLPTQINTLTYNGKVQSPEWSNFNDTRMSISGETEASEAGEHTVTFKPAAGYEWTDGSNQARSQTWIIGKDIISEVEIPEQSGTLTYNKEAQTPKWTAFDSNRLKITVEAQTDVGTYNATLEATSNCKFADDNTQSITLTWAIGKLSIAVPTLSNTGKTYSGNAQSPTISTYDSDLIDVSGHIQTNAGDYNVTFKLKDVTNTQWFDESLDDKTDSWKIDKQLLAVPTLSNTSKTYNKSRQSPTISSYNSNLIGVSGDTAATDVGSYAVVFSLKDTSNYQWNDETISNKSAPWSIGIYLVNKPTASSTVFSYDGNAKTLPVSGYDSTYMNQNGTITSTSAGNYTATYALKDTTNTKWSDNTTANVVINWSIGKKSVAVPPLSNTTKTYTGNSQSPTISTYDTNIITVSGNTQTNAGDYNVTFALKDTNNYQWSDGSYTNKTAAWKINKATPSISLSKTEMTLYNNVLTDTSTATRTGDGNIVASSNKTSVATVSAGATANNKAKITVTLVAAGSATITVSIQETTNYSAASATIAVTVDVMPALENCTPAQIQSATKAGKAPNYWNVGDKVPITVNGKINEGLTFNNETYYAFILGFDHLKDIESNGKPSIHFQYGMDALGTHIAFVDNMYTDITYSSTGPFVNSKDGLHFCHNYQASENFGTGWKNSLLRTCCTNFFNALPAAWQNIIVECKKFSNLEGGLVNDDESINNTYGYLSDKVWLLSNMEISGLDPYCKDYYAATRCKVNDIAPLQRYSLYQDKAQHVFYKHNEKSTDCLVWLRNKRDRDNLALQGYFCLNNNEASYNSGAYGYFAHSHGFAPCFMVA